MPRTPRNPGSGKAPFNGPAKGPGWGGEARGNGNGNPGALFTNGNTEGQGCRPTFKSLTREARIDALKELQWTLANEAEFETTRHAAQNALLDREEGKAVQRVVSANFDSDARVTEEQRASILAAMRACLTGPDADI